MEQGNGYVVLKIPQEKTEGFTISKSEKKQVCEVCGCVNEQYALQCKMCSNYFCGKTNGGRK